MRAGFTLIEAMVALVLFQIAALALTAAGAVAARDLAVAMRHTRAQHMAADRVARLRATACGSPTTGGVVHPGGLTEHWAVTANGRVRAIADSVAMVLPGGRQGAVVVRGWELCDD